MKSKLGKKLNLKKVIIAHHVYGGSATPNSEIPTQSSAFHEPTEVLSDFPGEDETDTSQNTTLISGNQQSCM